MTTVNYSETSIMASTEWSSYAYLLAVAHEDTVFSNRTTTSFTAKLSGLTFVGTGKNLKYDANHQVKSGTLDSFTLKLGGLEIAATKISTPIADILHAFDSADPTAFRSLFKEIFEGADYLRGSQSDDYLEGFRGNDRISGYHGEDELLGGKGADTLAGGENNDTLTGGSGRDHFKFGAAITGVSNVDTVRDFKHGYDKIEISNSVFDGIGPAGALASSKFKALDYFGSPDANDRIIYYKHSGDLYYDKDGSGIIGQVKIAHLDGLPTLTASDFLII